MYHPLSCVCILVALASSLDFPLSFLECPLRQDDRLPRKKGQQTQAVNVIRSKNLESCCCCAWAIFNPMSYVLALCPTPWARSADLVIQAVLGGSQAEMET